MSSKKPLGSSNLRLFQRLGLGAVATSLAVFAVAQSRRPARPKRCGPAGRGGRRRQAVHAEDRRDRRDVRHGPDPRRHVHDGQPRRSEPSRKPDEGPQFEVKVEPFFMGKHEVTWGEYDEFLRNYQKLANVQGDAGRSPRTRWRTRSPTRRRCTSWRPARSFSGWAAAAKHPAVIMSQLRGPAVHQVAQQKDRPLLPPADRGRVGIRLPRRHEDRLLLRRRPQEARRLRLVLRQLRPRRRRRRLPPGRQEEAQPLGPVRHATATSPSGASISTTTNWYKQFAGKTRSWPRTRSTGRRSSTRALVRGGGYESDPEACRSAARSKITVAPEQQGPATPQEPALDDQRLLARLPRRLARGRADRGGEAQVVGHRRPDRPDRSSKRTGPSADARADRRRRRSEMKLWCRLSSLQRKRVTAPGSLAAPLTHLAAIRPASQPCAARAGGRPAPHFERGDQEMSQQQNDNAAAAPAGTSSRGRPA